MSPRTRALGTRWLGVGLAACLAVITLSLAITGRIGLYINPDSAWFAVSMAVVTLIGAGASLRLPLGEQEHAHEHLHGDDHEVHERPVTAIAAVTGGAVASVVVVGMLIMPPASLSAELAASRDVGVAPLFAGTDTIALASTGNTAEFGVGDWASVFATATDPGAFEGQEVTLTGFVTAPGADGFSLTRLVITHCVIDAQTATLPVNTASDSLPVGQWVNISGTVRSTDNGELEVLATTVTPIDEPAEPYEF